MGEETSTNAPASAPTGTLRNICIHVVLLGLSMGIMISTQAALVNEIIGNVSSSSMNFGLIISLASLIQFFSQPFIGALSDSLKTRRIILLIQSGGMVLVFTLLALISEQKYTLKWFIVTKVFQALLGTSYNTAFAYVSDISVEADRAKAYGRLGMSFGIGFVFGPMVGGFLHGMYSLHTAFRVATIISAINVAWVALFIHDHIVNYESKSFSQALSDANPLKSMSILWSNGPFVRYIAIAVFFNFLSQTGISYVWSHYSKYRYGFTSIENGLFLSAIGLGVAMVQGAILKRFVNRFKESGAIRIAITFDILTCLIIAGATNKWIAYLSVPAYSLGGMDEPLQRALLSNSIGADKQATLQGAVASVISLARIISPLIVNSSFAYFTSESAPILLPSAPFLISGFICFFAYAAVHKAFKVQHHKEHKAE